MKSFHNTDKDRLHEQTKRKHIFRYIQNGFQCVFTNSNKAAIFAAYTLTATLVWLNRDALTSGETVFAALNAGIFRLTFFPAAALGALLLLYLCGTPKGAQAVHDGLTRAGLVNHAGEAPILVERYQDKENPAATVFELDTNAVPLTEWERLRAEIEAALNVYAVRIEQGKDKKHIRLYAVSGDKYLPPKFPWRMEYTSHEIFVIVLGRTLLDQVTVNLTKTAHILIGGSTGSGKTIVFKSIMAQCSQKGAVVFIADLKGGVDFPSIWDRKCSPLFDETSILRKLEYLVTELEARKRLFRNAECANIDDYNAKTGEALPRLVFGCDEIAELLDTTGKDKYAKERIAKIVDYLSTVARQGRAFGIHLILATQRPDANILPGQIKNNIDCRICGRADNVLSQIILDITDAADQIPKNAQGRFLMNDGTLFQAYWFDERTAFHEGGGGDE